MSTPETQLCQVLRNYAVELRQLAYTLPNGVGEHNLLGLSDRMRATADQVVRKGGLATHCRFEMVGVVRIVTAVNPAEVRASTNPTSTSVSKLASSSAVAGARCSRRSRTTASLLDFIQSEEPSVDQQSSRHR